MEHIIGPAYVVATGLFIFAAAGIIAWIYEKTRKRMEHPTLGRLTFTGESWYGTRPHYLDGRAPLRLELPGTKAGPDGEAVEKFEKLWNDKDRVLEAIAPYAINEMRDSLEAIEPSETKDFFGFAYEDGMELDYSHLKDNWFLTEVSLQDFQSDESSTVPKWCWALEFDVRWDDEHPRAAHLDLERNVLAYDLACATFIPE